MKILFMSQTGELNGVATRAALGGHEVRLFGALPQLSDVARSVEWRLDARRADLVVIDKFSASREAAPAALRLISRFTVGGLVKVDLPGHHSHFLAFFNGLEWMAPAFELISLDYMLAGDVGALAPNTALVLAPTRFPPAFWLDSQEAATAALVAADYRGPVRFEGDVAIAGIDPAELAAFCELLTAPLATTLYDIAAARTAQLPVVSEDAVAVRLSVPPYPWVTLADGSRPMIEIVPGAAKHFYAADVSVTFGRVGWSGLLGYATARGRGNSLREAGRRLDHVLSGISGAGLALQYRIDAISALSRRWERKYGTN